MALADQTVEMKPLKDASPELKNFVWQFLRHSENWKFIVDYRSARGDRFSVERDTRIGEANLSASGAPQRFLQLAGAPFCGTAGCDIYIFQKEGGRWRIVLDESTGADIRILDETDNGYRRLCVGRVVEAWDGSQYWPIPSGKDMEKVETNEDVLAQFVTCDDGAAGLQP